MTQIDAYLARVRFWLPGRKGAAAADDLRDVLAELIEDREQRLGRLLSEAEIETVSMEFGRPAVGASRYSTARPLVSAGLMPADVRVLGVSVIGVVIVQAALVTGALPDTGEAIRTSAGRIVTGLLWTFTSVTLAFAMLTRIFGPVAGEPEC